MVFKALIVLHTMIRNGATDNVLTYLSSEDVLKLKNVSSGQWEGAYAIRWVASSVDGERSSWTGYSAPKSMQSYASYLDMRIRTYRDLKHDPIRVQSDVNRDMRAENGLDDSRRPQRSKTIMGRKLRLMTVEKGLLRETKAVQRTITSLLECKVSVCFACVATFSHPSR